MALLLAILMASTIEEVRTACHHSNLKTVVRIKIVVAFLFGLNKHSDQ